MFKTLQNFLKSRKYTSQFFLANIDSAVKMQELIDSKKLFIISNDEDVQFVAFVSPTNILHIQGNYTTDAKILSVASQPNIVGVNGPTPLVNKFLADLTSRKVTTRYDDIVFSLDITNSRNHLLNLDASRLLKSSDFEQWFPLYTAYLKELDIPSSLSKEERRQRFFTATENKSHWGVYTPEGQLISIASFNAATGSSAQIGGVYTLPEYRGQGYGKIVMEKLIQDSIAVDGLNELILYTGPMDSAPARLYVSLGFETKDHYSMVVLK